uniref:Uncharacterized protein n=1 Tax=Mycobacterium leprae TaxID=1769 RepID=O07142_MYCLR|nr:hypothetical protein MLCL581.09 [Mycobacterium leprae]
MANAIAFALHYLLSIHHDIAAQTRREIYQNRSDRGIANVSYCSAMSLNCDAYVVSSTQLCGCGLVVPCYLRQARRDTTLGNGTSLFHKGQWVIVLLTAPMPGGPMLTNSTPTESCRKFAGSCPVYL